MAAKINTPQTAQQFMEYRLNETDGKILGLGDKIDKLTIKIDDAYATKEYIDGLLVPIREKVAFLYKAVWAIVAIVMGSVLITLLYSIGLKAR